MIPDPLNTVLVLKDTISSLVLEETRNLLNIACLSSLAEENIRCTLETVMKDMRADFELRKGRIQHEIRCLDIIGQRLAKSEVCLKQSDGVELHSDQKKANKRIRDAQRVLQDYLPKHDRDDYIHIVSTNIKNLCHKLIHIPLSINENIDHSHRNVTKDAVINQDVELQTRAYGHRGYQNSHPISGLNSPTKDTTDKASKISKTKHLSEVYLFSSDSEREDIVLGTEESEKSKASFDIASNGDTNLHNELDHVDTESKRLTSEHQTHEKQAENEHDDCIISDTVTKVTESRYEKDTSSNQTDSNAVKGNLITEKGFNHQPCTVGTNMLRRAVSQDDSNTEKEQLLERSYPKLSQRRVLPSLPRYGIQSDSDDTLKTTNSVGRSDLTGMMGISQLQESIDVEEIKFKETVRTARREIIERLKSRYIINQEVHDKSKGKTNAGTRDLLPHVVRNDTGNVSVTIPDLKDSNIGSVNTKTKLNHSTTIGLRDAGAIKATPSLSLGGNVHVDLSKKKHQHESQQTTTKDDEVFIGKLITVLPDRFEHPKHKPNVESTSQSNTDIKEKEDSMVEKAIQKFDNGRRKPQLFRLKKSGRSRSVDSINVNVMETDTCKQVLPKNTSLLPRTNSFDDVAGMDRGRESMFPDVNSSPLRRRSIQDDLNDVCGLESPFMIRRKWSQRKSKAFPVPSKVHKQDMPAVGPEFSFCESFKLPEHGSRCHASRLVTLSNGILVIFDETHSTLLFYDEKYLFLFHYNVPHVVSGIAAMDDQKLAVSYAYKSTTGIYLVLKTQMIWVQDISMSCTEWLSDIGYAHKKLCVLCKAGHIHILDEEGKEVKTVTAGKSGRLLVHPSGRRFFVIGEGFISRFDSGGQLVSTRELLDAFSVVLFQDRVYIGDRLKHKIVPVEGSEFVDLVADNLKYPSAMCLHNDTLLVSQFEEGMSVQDTRTVLIYRRKVRVQTSD